MVGMSSFRRLLSVDPSLTCSGWALFSVPEGIIKAVGKIRAEKPPTPLALRLEKLQASIKRVIDALQLGPGDVLVCEAPTTMKDPHNAIKVEQVRGLFESLSRERGVTVPGRVNPRSVQYEVMGLRGKQLARPEVKAAAVRTVEFLYADQLSQLGLSGLGKHQDIVDAVLIGRLALLQIEAARASQAPLETLFGGQEKQDRRSWRVKPCTIS
jgi:Holliday junction resolvasome RuvABC endonuclease subunit